MLWLFFALGSAALLGGYEVARKASVRDNAVLPVLLVANVGGLCLLLSGLFVFSFFPEQSERLGFSPQPLSARLHLYVLAKAALVTTSWVMAYFAVKRLPISIAGPLRSMSPLVTLIGAVLFFGEAPTPSEWAGIFVILLGYLGFAWLGPKEGIDFIKTGAVWLLLGGTVLGATSGLYDKHLLQSLRIDPTTLQLWFTVYNVGFQLILVGAIWWKRRKESPFRFSPVVPLVGCLLLLADQLYFRALSSPDALVSVVAMVRRASVIVSFTLGGFLFREQLLKKKSALLVVILLGVGLLFWR